jgi:DNA-binding transcriptional LysR family regulator
MPRPPRPRPPCPDWNDLRPFLAVADTGSLTAAARKLDLQHSTISRRIAALEHALGTRLFHRTPGGTSLTETGQRLLPLARKADAALAALALAARGAVPPLRLSLPTGLAPLLAPALASIAAKHPSLSIELLATSQSTDLSAGTADIALRLAPTTDPTLVIRTIGTVGLSLYASPAYLAAHPLPDPTRLHGHHLIGLHPDLAASPAAQWIDRHAADANIVLRLTQMAEVRATAASGVGLALLPCILADAAPDLLRVDPRVLVRLPLTMVCRRDVADDPTGRRILTLIAAAIAAQKAALGGEADGRGPPFRAGAWNSGKAAPC